MSLSVARGKDKERLRRKSERGGLRSQLATAEETALLT